MKKVVKIKFSALTRLGHFDYVGKASSILEQVTANNSVFNLTAPELTAFGDAVDLLGARTVAASGDNASKVTRDARDIQASVVLSLLVQIAINHVLVVACSKETYDEQKAIVTLAGYPIANDTKNPVNLEPVTGLALETSGIPGVSMVDVSWKRNGAPAYLIQTAPGSNLGPDTEWTTTAVATTSKIQLSLSAGTWSVRIISLKGTEQSEPCDPMSIVVG